MDTIDFVSIFLRQLLQSCYKTSQSLIFVGGCYDKGSYVDIFVYQYKANYKDKGLDLDHLII